MKIMSTLVKEFNDLLETNFKRPIGKEIDSNGRERLYSFYQMNSFNLSELKQSSIMISISSFNLVQLFKAFLEQHATKNTNFHVNQRNRSNFEISFGGEIVSLKFKSKDITVRDGHYSFNKTVKQVVSIELLDKEFEQITFLDVIEFLKNKRIEADNLKISKEQLKLNQKVQDEATFNELLITHNMTKDDFQNMLNLYTNFTK